MEPKLKKISESAIEAALAKATVYRHLNEPEEAESICRDVLEIVPNHPEGLRLLGLAMTDQFVPNGNNRYAEVEEIFQHLSDSYERFYYTGLLYERHIRTDLRAGRPPYTLQTLLDQAMACFAEAEKIRPVGNDDAILRWNSCVRLLRSQPNLDANAGFAALDISDGPPS